MLINNFSLEIVFEGHPFPLCYEAWAQMSDSWKAILAQQNILDRSTETRLIFSEVLPHLTRHKSRWLNFQVGDGFLSLGYIANSRLTILRLENLIPGYENIDELLSSSLEQKTFIQARFFCSEYELLQNMANIDLFESRGIAHSHLPKISNGLPPPLEKKVVDISHNPGRRIFKDGFMEFLGSPMWFDKCLLEKLGSRVDVLNQAEDVDVVDLGNVLKIIPSRVPFTSAGGQEGGQQDFLRDAIYPRAEGLAASRNL